MISLKKLMVTGLILVLIGGIGAFLTFRDNSIDIHEEKVFKENDITGIEVDSNNAGIEIIPTAEKETKVVLQGKGSSETKGSFTAKVVGEKLVVNWNEKQISFFQMNFIDESLTLKILVPVKEYKSLRINNDNGKIDLADLMVEQVQAESNNGRIHLQNIQSRSVEVNSDNGRVSLDHVSGSVKGETNNGRILMKTATLDQAIQLETDDGSIEIVTDKEPTNVTFDVQVDDGSINILDKYKGSTVIGNGENKVKLKTNNGKIRVGN
ncbi:DUF4097 family beta strand repeat-containing protein [Niallia circulans]|uniref:DUF4097 family beta strand repeat-containing protein n=1 Tax=Niallia circulans TaxID=1397 RepID=UPI0015613FBF|nr:DUF4097 family beta strand repeat-containing protein [Niallia circulans]NRG31924.1 DUF4097 family beta strand repeat protein [Niallia circulans]